MNKGRAPRPVRRMGTEIHEDRRTRRQRTRADEERAAVELQSLWEDEYYNDGSDDKIYAELYALALKNIEEEPWTP